VAVAVAVAVETVAVVVGRCGFGCGTRSRVRYTVGREMLNISAISTTVQSPLSCMRRTSRA
jgi:hypothetical protein